MIIWFLKCHQKTVICNSPTYILMGLLNELFPRLSEFPPEIVPKWLDDEVPWSILDQTSSNSLVKQIEALVGEEGGIFIHPSAELGEFVTIEGPCFIGEGVQIRHSAYLRSGSWICMNSIVGHSTEIKNSVLLPESKAPHFNYVGDSIIGVGANIGAGVKLSNVRNDGRGVSIRLKDGSKIETGLRKMGALVGDAVKIGCNVVTNPGSIIESGVMIGPNETLGGRISKGQER